VRLHLTRDPRTTRVLDDAGQTIPRVQAVRGVVLGNGRLRGQMVLSFTDVELADDDGTQLKPGDQFEVAIRDVAAWEFGLLLHHHHVGEELSFDAGPYANPGPRPLETDI
jgi:hypothetical protein